MQADWDYCKKHDDYLEEQLIKIGNHCDQLSKRYEQDTQMLIEVIQKQSKKVLQYIQRCKTESYDKIKTVSAQNQV